mmetsp:Transcript_6853/g.12980  ORF Transcript_6853/g.12980 Transcript_6853/m.12980 type:complete len:258 (-) Transcript_6853:2740-3513(-)
MGFCLEPLGAVRIRCPVVQVGVGGGSACGPFFASSCLLRGCCRVPSRRCSRTAPLGTELGLAHLHSSLRIIVGGSTRHRPSQRRDLLKTGNLSASLRIDEVRPGNTRPCHARWPRCVGYCFGDVCNRFWHPHRRARLIRVVRVVRVIGWHGPMGPRMDNIFSVTTSFSVRKLRDVGPGGSAGARGMTRVLAGGLHRVGLGDGAGPLAGGLGGVPAIWRGGGFRAAPGPDVLPVVFAIHFPIRRIKPLHCCHRPPLVR